MNTIMVGERERDTHTHTDRETETERQRQSDRDRDRNRETETEGDRQTDREEGRERGLLPDPGFNPVTRSGLVTRLCMCSIRQVHSVRYVERW